MVRENYINNAFSPLNGAINNSVTSLVVDDGTVFPTANFRVRVEDEIMFCTSRSGNTLTVIRGVEGTTAASHADNSEVDSPFTAGAVSQVRLDTIYAGSGAVARIGSSVHSADDEFDDETFSGWTKVWHGTAPVVTEVEQDHSLSLALASGGAAQQMTAYLKARTIASGDWVSCSFSFLGSGGAFPNIGLCFSDGTTYGSGNQVHFHWSCNEDVWVLRSTTGFDTQTAFDTEGQQKYPLAAAMHLKMMYKGSNQWDTFVSPDGIQWSQLHSNISMGSMTPTHLGISFSSWGAVASTIINYKYVRFKP